MVTDFYLLKDRQEKRDYKQLVKTDFYKSYANIEKPYKENNQELSARKFFFPYLNNVKIPERPYGSGRKGFYMKNEDFIAFKGIGKESSLFFHMLIVPTLKHGYNKEKDEIILKDCSSITKKHIPLLVSMKEEYCKWVQLNKNWFIEMFKNKDIEYWLQPENLQFGFHYPPSVGYLHLHAMVGPITEHGDRMKYRCINLKDVLNKLQ